MTQLAHLECAEPKTAKFRQNKINANLEKCLCGYVKVGLSNRAAGLSLAAIAAGSIMATGMSVLALDLPVQAEVVFTPANQALSGYHEYAAIDFNHDGEWDAVVSVSNRFYNTSGCVHSGGILKAWGQQPGNGFVVNARGFAAAGRAGQQAGPSNNFGHDAEMATRGYAECVGTHSTIRTSYGPWKDNKQERFLGVKFSIGPGPTPDVHYGWIRMKDTGGGYGTLTGYAYETIPNKPITAGLDDSGKPFPEPTGIPARGLGRLAAGARSKSK